MSPVFVRMIDSSRAARLFVGALIVCATLSTAVAQRDAWELRVCADPSSLPFSNAREEGYENRIAELLADELAADLSFDWYPQGSRMISERLRAGECDLIMGVPDGLQQLLSTVAYYRSPYVFVYREDAPFEIASLDDPVLHELRIAVQSVGIPPHDALVSRGLGGNVESDHLSGEGGAGIERSRALFAALLGGEIDVALAWGPVAGYLARQSEVELVVEPVTPEYEPPFRIQSFAMTIGLRPGDEALRDLLNLAIAARWEEIEGVLNEYGVPLTQLPKPLANAPGNDLPQVALITPTLTGESIIRESLFEVAGEAARLGALLAESDVAADGSEEEAAVEVLYASTPSAAAAERAAKRLAATTSRLVAIVGGLGEGQAETLARLSEGQGMPFLNVGSARMPRSCRPHLFHIEASAAMYLEALVEWFSGQGADRWFVVHQEGEGWAELLEPARLAVEEHGAGSVIVGTAAVAPGQPAFRPELERIRASGADTVLLMVNPRDQIAFTSQLSSFGLDVQVAPLPNQVTQTRDYLAADRLHREREGVTYRLLLWETTLEDHGAGDLNDRFMTRWGEPMAPAAWASYQAVQILHQALQATGASDDPSDLSRFLSSPEARFDVAKGVPVSFHTATHQLRQPLYMVEVDPRASWMPVLSHKVAIAHLAGQIPPAEHLLQNGAEGHSTRNTVNVRSCSSKMP